jgi:hypothetical protein
MSAVLRRRLLLLCLMATIAASFWPQGDEQLRPPARSSSVTPARVAPVQTSTLPSTAVTAPDHTAASALTPEPASIALTLFGPSTVIEPPRAASAEPPPVAEPPPPMPLAPAPPPLRLRGLFADGAGPSRAFIEDNRGQAWLVSTGEWLDGPGNAWQLESVDAEGALLLHRDGETRHRLLLTPPG